MAKCGGEINRPAKTTDCLHSFLCSRAIFGNIHAKFVNELKERSTSGSNITRIHHVVILVFLRFSFEFFGFVNMTDAALEVRSVILVTVGTLS